MDSVGDASVLWDTSVDSVLPEVVEEASTREDMMIELGRVSEDVTVERREDGEEGDCEEPTTK